MQNISKFTWLVAFLCLATSVAAQTDAFDGSSSARNEPLEPKNAPRVRSGKVDAELTIKKPEGYPAKDLPKDYTGYRIEIVVADSLLAKDHDLFFRHGNIVLEALTSDKFAYTIGDFTEEAAAREFLQQFILVRYPEARVVAYQTGKRKGP